MALVCYGGVSLAIYMYGVTREIQKLVRASKFLHGVRDEKQRRTTYYDALNDDPVRETDSERIYFELLQRLGIETELRVMVDIIAGASAGGINGVMLAQALSCDVPLDPLRDMWLRQADVEQLLDKSAISGKWDKLFMRPLLCVFEHLQAKHLSDFIGDDVSQEVRTKLSRFVRSRWFQPPFSGPEFAGMLYDALLAMEKMKEPGKSLLPPGYPLDLFVTVTDFFGYAQNIKLHSPPQVREREHRLVLDFRDTGINPNGTRMLGDLGDLAFAARATASFPGAFPPATLMEMEQAIAKRDQVWDGKRAFVRRALKPLLYAGADPESAAFLDGAILNNKPFGEAIAALRNRPAYREVDRRIVYIEPNPARMRPLGQGKSPGFFTAIRASISDIPRNQPVRDELEWVEQHSAHVEQLRAVIDGMSDEVEQEIEDTLGERFMFDQLSVDTLVQWRDIAHKAAARSAGYAYGAYAELKTYYVLSDLAALLANIASGMANAPRSAVLEENVLAWAREAHILPVRRVKQASLLGDYLPWVDFLRTFDGRFRMRRIRFIIRTLNRFYALDEAQSMPQAFDAAKKTLYKALNLLNQSVDLQRFPKSLVQAIQEHQREALPCDAKLIAEIGEHLGYMEIDEAVDSLVLEACNNTLPPNLRRRLILAYLGFPFYDLVTLPMLQNASLDEFDPIKVDRISPEDANTIRKGGARACLKGASFGNFGAFFSRAYRENDYLWGRLHSADRLVDIVLSAVPKQGQFDAAAILALKQKLFHSILNQEALKLSAIADTIASIRQEINAMA
jgi:patatin-related protein